MAQGFTSSHGFAFSCGAADGLASASWASPDFPCFLGCFWAGLAGGARSGVGWLAAAGGGVGGCVEPVSARAETITTTAAAAAIPLVTLFVTGGE